MCKSIFQEKFQSIYSGKSIEKNLTSDIYNFKKNILILTQFSETPIFCKTSDSHMIVT